MKEVPQPVNRENHIKNLHGAPGVDGLTGRWHGTFFDRGIARVKDQQQLVQVREKLAQLGGENR